MAKRTSDDKQTVALIDRVKAKKAEISRLSKPTWKTNGSFTMPGQTSVSVPIRVESDRQRLGMIIAFLITMETAYREAQERVGPLPPFTWGNSPVEDWTEDVKTRLSILALSEKQQELAKLESMLEGVISPELRRQMTLDEVEKKLGS